MTFTGLQCNPYGNLGGQSNYINTATSSVINCPYTCNGTGMATQGLMANFQTQTWSAWNGNFSNTANSVSTTTWHAWCQGQVVLAQVAINQQQVSAVERRRIEVQLEERDKIQARAKAWLVEMLSDNQREEFSKSESFELRTDRYRYRIRPGQRVEELDEKGVVVARLCIHPPDPVPGCDIAVCQKLWIEGNEEEFRRIANRRAA